MPPPVPPSVKAGRTIAGSGNSTSGECATIEGGLAAEGRQDRVGTLAIDHLRDRLGVERLEVGRVGPLGVGHDRRRIRVDEDDAVALAPQHTARLRTGVVELARLPDADRA
jgi:hypothetical protein